MTGSEYCEEWGLDSVVELSIISGVPRSTLNKRWHTKNKEFRVLVAGAAATKLIELTGISDIPAKLYSLKI